MYACVADAKGRSVDPRFYRSLAVWADARMAQPDLLISFPDSGGDSAGTAAAAAAAAERQSTVVSTVVSTEHAFSGRHAAAGPQDGS